MSQEKLFGLTGWFMGFVGGFLLRGNMFRNDDFTGYLSSLMMIASGIIIVLSRNQKLK